jgi:hypothetical protein
LAAARQRGHGLASILPVARTLVIKRPKDEGTQVARLALNNRSVPLAEVQIALVGLLDLRAPAAMPSALRTDTPEHIRKGYRAMQPGHECSRVLIQAAGRSSAKSPKMATSASAAGACSKSVKAVYS